MQQAIVDCTKAQSIAKYMQMNICMPVSIGQIPSSPLSIDQQDSIITAALGKLDSPLIQLAIFGHFYISFSPIFLVIPSICCM